MPRAKIVPCFPSGTLKSDEQQSTVAERPLLPLAGLFRPTHQNYWKMELAPFRCSVPHSPSLEEGVAGTIARIKPPQRNRPLQSSPKHFSEQKTLRLKLLVPVYSK